MSGFSLESTETLKINSFLPLQRNFGVQVRVNIWLFGFSFTYLSLITKNLPAFFFFFFFSYAYIACEIILKCQFATKKISSAC